MGPGSGEEDSLDGFIGELATLVDAPDELVGLKGFCKRYDPSVLAEALQRLRRTPRERIRTNPAALFTFLVKTIDREHHA